MYATYADYFMCRYGNVMSVCMLHMNLLQYAIGPGALVYIQDTLLAYAPEQICLPHYMHMPHCTATVVYI